MTTSNSNLIDKQALYGDYRDSQKKRDRLYMKAAHKSLDIPDDDMGDIKTDNSQHGIGALGAVAIAAVAGGLPLAILWLAGVFNNDLKPEPPKSTYSDFTVGEPIVE